MANEVTKLPGSWLHAIVMPEWGHGNTYKPRGGAQQNEKGRQSTATLILLPKYQVRMGSVNGNSTQQDAMLLSRSYPPINKKFPCLGMTRGAAKPLTQIVHWLILTSLWKTKSCPINPGSPHHPHPSLPAHLN